MRKLLIVLAALTTLVVAGPALAAKIKSGTSTVTLSEGASTALTAHGIVVTPIAPATATLKLTKYAARQLNKLAGTDFAKAGDLLGTGKVVVSDSATPTAPAPPVAG